MAELTGRSLRIRRITARRVPYANVIAVQPTNPNVIFAGGAFTTTLVRSLDGGATWATLQSAQNFGFLHADMHALSFFPEWQYALRRQ